MSPHPFADAWMRNREALDAALQREARPAALLPILTESAALTELTAKINRAVRHARAPVDLKRAFDRAIVTAGAVEVVMTHGARGLVASLRPCQALDRAAEHAAAGREQAALQALITFIEPVAPIEDRLATIAKMRADMAAERAATEAMIARLDADIARLKAGLGLGEVDDPRGEAPRGADDFEAGGPFVCRVAADVGPIGPGMDGHGGVSPP